MEEIEPQSKTLIAISMLDNSFYDRCIERLPAHVAEAGLQLVHRPTDLHEDIDDLIASLGNPCGVLLIGFRMAPIARRAHMAGHRVVMVGTPPLGETMDIPWVHGSHEECGYLACRHLIHHGHQRLLYVHNDADAMKSSRWFGGQRAVSAAVKAGIAVEIRLCNPEEYTSWGTNPQAMRDYFLVAGGPTAIIAWNDEHAIRLLDMLARAGITVPDQVSLIGYDALPRGETTNPPLTTIDGAIEKQLHAAVDLLSRRESVPFDTSVFVMPALVVRKSTGPVARRIDTAG